MAFLSLCILPILFLIFLKYIVLPGPIKIPIKSRHVFITGGSSGIGLALARQAVLEGARVTILALDMLEEAKNSIRLSTGIDVATVKADVCDFEAIKEAIENAGEIDVLICNQGVFEGREVEKQEIKVIKRMIDVNLTGTINVVKAALPGMKNRRDKKPVSISFMSSHLGQVGPYGYAVYSASKFGLRGFAEALQHEVITDGIYVSLIFPPETDTPGREKDIKNRPQLSNLIAGSYSTTMQADEVAIKALNGIKTGRFIISCNFFGILLSIASAGFSPQRSYLMALVEVLFGGVVRIVGLVSQLICYRMIKKWHVNSNEKIST